MVVGWGWANVVERGRVEVTLVWACGWVWPAGWGHGEAWGDVVGEARRAAAPTCS
jgi:hypothetical protein